MYGVWLDRITSSLKRQKVYRKKSMHRKSIILHYTKQMSIETATYIDYRTEGSQVNAILFKKYKVYHEEMLTNEMAMLQQGAV